MRIQPRPPSLILKILQWFCKEERIDEVEGDIIELYEKRWTQNKSKAKWQFAWDVLRSFRPVNIRSPHLINLTMIKIYFKIGFRNIRKDYKYSIINLTGMSIGLAVFVVMIMLVKHEYSYDNFHRNGDRIFEVVQIFTKPNGEADPEIWTSAKLSDALREELTIVENAVTIHSAASNWVETDQKRFFEEDGIVAGPQFFEIFDFELVSGDIRQVLASPRSTVINESLSRKYFGNENPIGKEIDHYYYGKFTVTGVLKDIPSNSTIQFEYILTQDYDKYFTMVASWFPRWFQSWRGGPVATFVQLKDPLDRDQLSEELRSILSKHLEEEEINEHTLLNIRDMHFGSNHIDGSVNRYEKGSAQQIHLFVIVAIIVLILACFNYINITTARSIRRNKEVGIRKSIGAFQLQITTQFLIESFMLTFLSMILALGITYLILPYFNLIMGISISFSEGLLISIVPYLVLLCILVTVLAGFYPAVVLSRISAIRVMRNTFLKRGTGNVIRNVLVSIQFTLVIILSISLLIINQQYRFINNRSLGFDKDQQLIVEINSGGVRNNYSIFKSQLLEHTEIKGVTGLTRIFSGYRSPVSVSASTVENPEDQKYLKYYGMDEDGIDVLGLELVSGVGFRGIKTEDSTSVILNETAAARFGGNEVVGEWILINSDEDERFRAQVKGIVKDFHFESLHEPIKPVVIGYYLNPFMGLDDIVIKIDGNRTEEALAIVEKIHNNYDTNDVMTWEFLDQMVQRAYEKEVKYRNIFSGASIISLLIALLGMIGLISYNATVRTKEFGIRKVLGASFMQLMSLQGQSFYRYIVLASTIAIPITWFLAIEWLKNYAFRVDIGMAPFVVIIASIVGITFVITFLIGFKVAKENPVNSLRYE